MKENIGKTEEWQEDKNYTGYSHLYGLPHKDALCSLAGF
jgi:hypothetical protein